MKTCNPQLYIVENICIKDGPNMYFKYSFLPKHAGHCATGHMTDG